MIDNVMYSSAGAKFFVVTTKHHDGIALFDTKETSNRSTVALSARRDFIRELMDAAKVLEPDLKRGTYFSLPVSEDVSTIVYLTTDDLNGSNDSY
jgi:alpha-L-fucosidase